MFLIIVKLFFLVIIQTAVTPFIRRLAFVLEAVDNPNARHVSRKSMPTIGGLSIFVTFNIGIFILLRKQFPTHEAFSILLVSSVMVLTGLIDDILELKPKQKLAGQVITVMIIYSLAGIRMKEIILPFSKQVITLGWWSLPITISWILALTNTVNSIDGLDGLATGVSLISLSTMGVAGYFFLHIKELYIPTACFILAAALLGFLPHNFHPAEIFLDDTGALYIGFMISILSLEGLKNVTSISLIVSIIILGAPITDIVYAMVRRRLNHKPISQADKHYLHHQLMRMGFSRRQAVLCIYGTSLVFSFVLLPFLLSPSWGIWPLILGLLVALEFFAESVGLLGDKYYPLLNLIRRMINSTRRSDSMVEVWHLDGGKPSQLKRKTSRDNKDN